MNFFNKTFYHLFSDIKISNNTIFHWAYSFNFSWCSSQHLFSFISYS